MWTPVCKWGTPYLNTKINWTAILEGNQIIWLAKRTKESLHIRVEFLVSAVTTSRAHCLPSLSLLWLIMAISGEPRTNTLAFDELLDHLSFDTLSIMWSDIFFLPLANCANTVATHCIPFFVCSFRKLRIALSAIAVDFISSLCFYSTCQTLCTALYVQNGRDWSYE